MTAPFATSTRRARRDARRPVSTQMPSQRAAAETTEQRRSAAARDARAQAVRITAVMACVCLGVGSIAVQLVRLAAQGQTRERIAVTAPISESYSRPRIVDYDGNVLAVDLLLPSIIADPAKLLDVDETYDALVATIPGLDGDQLRKRLANRDSRFAWVARKVSTETADRVQNLGLPGISHRWETTRAYPAGVIAGHVLGAVNLDNRGVAGLERYLDRVRGLRIERGDLGDGRPALQLSLRLSVQHALEEELAEGMRRYGARAASGVVLDVETGAVAASASVPEVDPAFPATWLEDGPIDRVAAGTYELGSVLKPMAIAMGLELGVVSLDSQIRIDEPIVIGRTEFRDLQAHRGSLSVEDIFVRSSNVGVGRIALAVGSARQRAFLSRIGLLGPMETESGAIKPPAVPAHWGDVETVTVAYGHGLAVAPLQFAAVAASLVNGGFAVMPTFVRRPALPDAARKRVLSQHTSDAMRKFFRANVASSYGTGQAAEIPGYEIGGKTGTADRIGVNNAYDGANVLTSFVAAFPMSKPRYVVLVSLFNPTANLASGGTRTASANAAPLAGRLIKRIAPLLEVLPAEGATD